MFNYILLLQKHKGKINEDALPNEIKTAITLLGNLQTELSDSLNEDDSSPDDIKCMKKEISALDSKICELILEEIEDNETEDDESEKEEILKSLFDSGKTRLSIQQLSSFQYPVEGIGKGEKVGAFRIDFVKPKNFTGYYEISKV